MPFIKSFVDKKIEVSAGGWDFSQDNREPMPFDLGGFSLEQDARGDDYITSTEVAKAAAAATLT